MADNDQADTRRANPAGYSGLLANLRGLAATAIEHGRLRFQVLEAEGRDAAGHYLRLAIVVGVAVVLLLFAYLLLLVGGIFLLAELTQWSWAVLTASAGALHLAAAVILMLVGRHMLGRPVLAATINEFKLDTEWLRNHSSKTSPNVNS